MNTDPKHCSRAPEGGWRLVLEGWSQVLVVLRLVVHGPSFYNRIKPSFLLEEIPKQCCGSAIRCLFYPELVFFRIPALKPRFLRAWWQFFGVKNIIILCKVAQSGFKCSKIKYLWLLKKVGQQIFSSSFVAVLGSRIRDRGWIKIRIRDKHHGSATLEERLVFSTKKWRSFFLLDWSRYFLINFFVS